MIPQVSKAGTLDMSGLIVELSSNESTLWLINWEMLLSRESKTSYDVSPLPTVRVCRQINLWMDVSNRWDHSKSKIAPDVNSLISSNPRQTKYLGIMVTTKREQT